MIVLDRLDALRKKHEHVLDKLVMDILRVLNTSDMDVKRKALGIALEMVSSRNAEEVVLFLKKELVKTLDATYEKVRFEFCRGYDDSVGLNDARARIWQNPEYRQLLIQSIHSCAIKFSEVASSVVHVLMEFLGDSSNTSAVDVIAFVRSARFLKSLVLLVPLL
jgi:coatomer subunit beta